MSLDTVDRPPLIVHVIYRLDFGGLENGLVNLLNHMPVERYRHAIVCLAGVGEEFRRRLRRSDVEVVSLGKRAGKDPGAYIRFWRLLRRLRADIVHTRNLGTIDLQWVAAVSGVAHRVHGEHGWEASDPRGEAGKALRIRRACRPVINAYVPMSRDLERWLVDKVGIARDRVHQLYTGVDTTRFSPAPEDPARVASTGGIATVTIGTIGRLDPVKNHAALIATAGTLIRDFPNVRIVIVGDGPQRVDLEASVVKLGLEGRVAFTGSRSDTPELLRQFDLFVLPSLNEGISNTILEAMATGLPVVAARVGGNPELVVDGVTGSLYDPARQGALHQAIWPYLTDPALRRARGRAGRDRIVQNFSIESMVDRYLAFYDELIAS